MLAISYFLMPASISNCTTRIRSLFSWLDTAYVTDYNG